MSYFGSKEFLIEVEKGNVPGHSTVHKFGRNDSVGATLEPVCDGGNYQTPTSAQALELLSSSANDTSAGTGLRSVTIEGLDGNAAFQTETVTTNGTSAVALANTYLRVFRLYASTSGTYATTSTPSQVGTITLRGSGGGSTWATLPVTGSFGLGQSLIGAYTVPAGKTAYILSAVAMVDAAKTADIYFFSRSNVDVASAPFDPLRVKNVYVGVVGYQQVIHRSNESYVAKTDIGFLATASPAADVSVEFELLLVDD